MSDADAVTARESYIAATLTGRNDPPSDAPRRRYERRLAALGWLVCTACDNPVRADGHHANVTGWPFPCDVIPTAAVEPAPTLFDEMPA